MEKQKAYSILGLTQSASEEEIKTAYRSLAQHYSSENYQVGLLKEEGIAKMDELNEAFDMLMSDIRTSVISNNTNDNQRQQNPNSDETQNNEGRYASVRQMINGGRLDEAMAELTSVQNTSDGEWNFLMGSVFYYKGWLDQAQRYFQEAVRLAPANAEYQAALRNISNSSQGNMQGNPYANANQDPSGAAMNCACNTCSLMCCMDACCSCGRC